jgi:hypothetical protein
MIINNNLRIIVLNAKKLCILNTIQFSCQLRSTPAKRYLLFNKINIKKMMSTMNLKDLIDKKINKIQIQMMMTMFITLTFIKF